MSAKLISEHIWNAVSDAGLAGTFDSRGVSYVGCPACGAKNDLKLSLKTARVSCGTCGLEGPLLTYLKERYVDPAWLDEVTGPAEIIVFDPERSQKAEERIALVKEETDTRSEPVAPVVEKVPTEVDKKTGGLAERIIITFLAVAFLVAGLAAAGLSGFANYQAFSAMVADPVQARIWAWAGVIASVCSLGGFTVFWWHLSAKRAVEAMRVLMFALAGAATSLAGTALFMDNNFAQEAAEQEQVMASRAVIERQIEDWSRQLAAIPPQTRSVQGLEAYLRGVEAVGRTHQKPYRDAQNELGLAKRRASLEAQIERARASLMGRGEFDVAIQASERRLPGWMFALILEVFSSQGTSIAFVSLLLLYGAKHQTQPVSDCAAKAEVAKV
ncbi:MAG: hypothetical protein AAGG45_10545 [Pseudomonadota bacterium]